MKESEAVNVKIRADLHRKNLIEARDFKKGGPNVRREGLRWRN